MSSSQSIYETAMCFLSQMMAEQKSGIDEKDAKKNLRCMKSKPGSNKPLLLERPKKKCQNKSWMHEPNEGKWFLLH